jgi:hypothetical protein
VVIMDLRERPEKFKKRKERKTGGENMRPQDMHTPESRSDLLLIKDPSLSQVVVTEGTVRRLGT